MQKKAAQVTVAPSSPALSRASGRCGGKDACVPRSVPASENDACAGNSLGVEHCKIHNTAHKIPMQGQCIQQQQTCRGPVSVPSLGIPFLVRGDSSWVQESRSCTVTSDTGAPTPVTCFTCVAERTRRKSAQGSGDAQSQYLATGRHSQGDVSRPKSGENVWQRVQGSKRKRDASCPRSTAATAKAGVPHRNDNRRISKGKRLSETDRLVRKLTTNCALLKPAAAMEIPGGLTIYSFGRIEFLNPMWHTKDLIYPVGYHAARDLTMSGSVQSIHLRVKEGEDHGPLLCVHVSTQKDPLVQSSSPAEAWNAIRVTVNSKGESKPAGRFAKLFGLSHSHVLQKLVDMEGSQYLGKLTSNSEVTVPVRQPIPDHMKQQQKRVSAAAFRLPSNVKPQVHRQEAAGVCDICRSDAETSSVRLLCCAKCGATVHNTCYGTKCPPVGSVWLCEVCEAGIDSPPVCALCPVLRGAMRFTQCGRWVHCVCALWIPEVTLKSQQAPCIDKVPAARCSPLLECTVCHQPYGAHVQCCAGRKCYVAFHPLCVMHGGLPYVALDLSDSCVAESLEAQLRKHVPPNARPPRGGRIVENQGVTVNDCIRLLAFCERHRSCADFEVSSSKNNKVVKAPAHSCALEGAETLHGKILPHGLSVGGLLRTCARLLVSTGEAKSGVQKPDLAAVAQRKRQYVEMHPAAPLIGDLPYGGLQKATCTEVLASDLDRFKHMHATVSLRLTPGKSKIHGMGVFARVPIRAGDWVIEYVGELIRPPVLDVREQRIYDKMIGGGTYTFRLPCEDGDMCLDATQSGNGAQLLNHSCDPNCFSATKAVRFEDGVVVHKIIIVSRRQIAPGEELTYDYRFAGEETLHCFCGASECRGVVNHDVTEAAEATLQARRTEVEFISHQQAQEHIAVHGEDSEDTL